MTDEKIVMICEVCLEPFTSPDNVTYMCNECGRCGFCEDCSDPTRHDCNNDDKE